MDRPQKCVLIGDYQKHQLISTALAHLTSSTFLQCTEWSIEHFHPNVHVALITAHCRQGLADAVVVLRIQCNYVQAQSFESRSIIYQPNLYKLPRFAWNAIAVLHEGQP